MNIIKGFGAEAQELSIFSKVDEISTVKSMTAQALMASSGVLMIGLASAGVIDIGSYLGLDTENLFLILQDYF